MIKKNADQKNSMDLPYVNKIIDWVLHNSTKEDLIKNRFFKWDKNDYFYLKNLLNKGRDDQLATITKTNSKFKKFILSIIENGINTSDVILFHRYKNKLPLEKLGLEIKLKEFRESKGKLISITKLRAGYYILELGLNHSEKLATSAFSISSHSNLGPIAHLPTLRDQKISKRLIYLERDEFIHIKSTTFIKAGYFSHFRIARVTRNFFLSRLFRKISKKNNLSAYDKIKESSLKKLYLEYNDLFTKYPAIEKYSKYIMEVEKKLVPSSSDQIKEIIRLMGEKSKRNLK